MRHSIPLLLCAGLSFGMLPTGAPAAAMPRRAAPPTPAPLTNAERIVAVVNGDAITNGDVTARTRLFAVSTGLPVTQDVLDRLRPQILKQLIDERLRLQEAQRRKIVVGDKDIADTLGGIEQRNGMKPGALRAALESKGVAWRTMVDQVRTQLAWTKVLREELGEKGQITDADIAEQTKLYKAQVGQPEYHIGEIFIPIDDPAKAADAERFADTVIGELRKGAPFPVIAAQFSQSQTALQGGDLGWLRANQIDPEVANVVKEMPPGAISNPVRVPGGIDIVTLAAKRVLGQEQSTMLNVRQAFFPFSTPLNPKAPTEQQRQVADMAATVAKSAHSCADIEAANVKAGNTRPANPGQVRLEGIGSVPLRTLLASLPVGQASKPLVATDGVAVVMICDKQVQTDAAPSKQDITNMLINQRVEMTARQLQRDLRRRAVLDLRTDSAALN